MSDTTAFLRKGAVLLEPAPVTWGSSEGALVRNPDNPNEWGIFYNGKASSDYVMWRDAELAKLLKKQ